MDKSRIPSLAKSVKDQLTLFHRGSDPWLARLWLENLTDTFAYISCTEAEKVELAMYHLRDQAVTWWKTQRTVLGERDLSWLSFRKAFEKHYFSVAFCQLKTMIGCSITQGLTAYIRLKMSSCPVSTYREALDRALLIETTQQQTISAPQSQFQPEWRPSISQPVTQPSSAEVGRVYAITREEAQRADGSVIRGMVSVYAIFADTLIDTGEVLTTNQEIKRCPLDFNGHTLTPPIMLPWTAELEWLPFDLRINPLGNSLVSEDVRRWVPWVFTISEDVFQDELPGLPPQRQVQFTIEVIPGTAPVSKAPYRMTPKELEELKIQLQFSELGLVEHSRTQQGVLVSMVSQSALVEKIKSTQASDQHIQFIYNKVDSGQ
ncbi:uncharacterized protein LOC141847564 [Curcuma longa]|uniref:uncharacterized protein LOC141847564 n=1 Tax=Curcuma longa TaxID=136217 RepID=UPI003D9DD32F